jgi:hypothetical protein
VQINETIKYKGIMGNAKEKNTASSNPNTA